MIWRVSLEIDVCASFLNQCRSEAGNIPAHNPAVLSEVGHAIVGFVKESDFKGYEGCNGWTFEQTDCDIHL